MKTNHHTNEILVAQGFYQLIDQAVPKYHKNISINTYIKTSYMIQQSLSMEISQQNKSTNQQLLDYVLNTAHPYPCAYCRVNISAQPFALYNQQIMCCACLSKKIQPNANYKIISSSRHNCQAKKIKKQLEKLSAFEYNEVVCRIENGTSDTAQHVIDWYKSSQSLQVQQISSNPHNKTKGITKDRNKPKIQQKPQDPRLSRMKAMRYNFVLEDFDIATDNIIEILLSEENSQESLKFLMQQYTKTKQYRRKIIDFIKKSDLLLTEDQIKYVQQLPIEVKAIRKLQKQHNQ